MSGNSGRKNMLAISVTCMLGFAALSQITPDRFQQFISDNKQAGKEDVKYATEIQAFYSLLNFNTAWINKENEVTRTIFLNALKLSDDLGLRKNDYHFNALESYCNNKARLQNINDSVQAEVRLTGAAIHFYNDIAYGNTKPVLGYMGLSYMPGCHNIPALLAEYISKNLLQLLIARLSPALPETTAISGKIRWFHAVMADSNFREVIITSGKVSVINKPLVSKLYQLGLLDPVSIKKSPIAC